MSFSIDSSLLEAFRDFAAKAKPPQQTALTHYTSLDGFRCIIDSNQLWASNVRFLNDRKEMEYGIEQSVKFLNSIERTVAKDEQRKILNKAKNNISNGIPDVYACCFSEEKDSLSQWRGYTDQTQGVAIDFNYEKLSRHFMNDKAALFKVSYGDDETAKILKSNLQGIVTIPQNFEPGMADKATSRVESLILGLIPRFKHHSFKNEAEWRLVVSQPTEKNNVVFRTKDNVLVPFIRLGGNSSPLPIKSVRIGPGKDMKITRRSIELFLKSKLGYEEIPVEVSTVPFRS